MASDCRVLVFAKAPRPGSVKTRLIPLLGAEGAATLHRQLVRHALGTAVKADVGAVELWCTPDANDAFLSECAGTCGASLHVQQGGDLGARMAHAFRHALQTSRAVVLIGCDCAALEPRHVREAAAALAAGMDAVLSPTEDGGYALIGLTRHDSVLFEGVAWGTATVMAGTRDRLRRLGWHWSELATLWDIDRPQDYQRLCAARLLADLPS